MSRVRRFFKILPKDHKVHFFLKTPKHGKGRASFAIIKKITDKGKKPRFETLDLDELISVNMAFKKGEMPFEKAELHCKEIIDRLYERYRSSLPAVVHNQENLRVLDEYWKKEFEDKDLIEPAASFNRLARAVEGVGTLSLISSSKEELQKEIDSKFKGNKQRAIVSALNQILKHIGRNIKLRKVREEIRDVRYLNENEFRALYSSLEDPNLQLIYASAFAAGLRIGEVFAIRPNDLKDGILNVATQIDRAESRRHTKNRKVRKVLVLESGLKAVQAWALVPLEQKLKYRNFGFSKLTRRLCKKLFPKDSSKHCTVHDLRHSYAVYLVSKGVSLSQVAQALGDSVAVAEKHYSGYVLTPESIDLMRQVLKRAK